MGDKHYFRITTNARKMYLLIFSEHFRSIVVYSNKIPQIIYKISSMGEKNQLIRRPLVLLESFSSK